MKNPKTVYVLLEDLIDKGVVKVDREIELGNHGTRVIVFLNEIRNLFETMKVFLVNNPSVQATNLANQINGLFEDDPSMQCMTIQIEFVENPDKGKAGFINLKMY